jgi:hypothetical protein
MSSHSYYFYIYIYILNHCILWHLRFDEIARNIKKNKTLIISKDSYPRTFGNLNWSVWNFIRWFLVLVIPISNCVRLCSYIHFGFYYYRMLIWLFCIWVPTNNCWASLRNVEISWYLFYRKLDKSFDFLGFFLSFALDPNICMYACI